MRKTCARIRPLAAAIAATLFAAVSVTVPISAFASEAGVASSGMVQDEASPAVPADGQAAGQKEKKATNLSAVTVTGVLGSQMRAIDLKRMAPSIQDSISAEDIGKLPDVTISDSLQRITGVQIDRSAGEGSSVEVRGLPQVGTWINGESFLTSGQIVSVQPNFTDIPSQLFAGADVIKSPTASDLDSGITGTINLRTRRPWDMKSGWTVSGSADATRGNVSKETEPEANGLVSFNADGRWGVLVSAAYSDITHDNSNTGLNQYGGKLFGENAASATAYDGFLGSFNSAPIPSAIHQLGGGDVDVNGNGNASDAFYGAQDFTILDNKIERKRLGINASAQADLGSGFTLTSDAFFTRQTQYSRINGYQFNSASWLGASFVPLVSRDTGKVVHSAYAGDGDWNQELYTTQVYEKWLGDMETYAENDVTKTISRNFNLQLDYDNGGPFTASVRGITASAHELLMQSYVQFTDADGTAWPNDPVDAAAPGTYVYPGGNRVFNANGLAPNTVPVVVDMRGTNMGVSLPTNLQGFLANPDNYVLKTVSSEGNHERRSAMNILRADGHYDFNDGFKLDFGVRNSIRSASNINFNMVAPVYAGNGASDPNGCLVRWKAADVVLNGGGIAGACTAGNGTGYYRAGVLSAQNPSQLPALLADNFKLYHNLAGVNGVSIYNLDPSAMDNPLAFQNALYPGEQRNVDPGGTWAVSLKERTGYLQGNFDTTVAGMPFAGNVGVRVVRTSLDVTQHAVGDAEPYGLLAADNGTIRTSRQYTDVLPDLNLALDLNSDLKLRFAYSKNMMPLNLDQWGGGLTLNYAIDTSTPGSTLFRVLGGSSSGSPQLNPWRSSNYDLSLEYYMGPSSMISLAAFYVDVASFIKNGAVETCNLPDQDGVVRGRCVTVNSPIQGEGNSLHGLEFDYKQGFTSLPGWWSHTGIDVNYTYSPSTSGARDLSGRAIPFQDNSENTSNLVLWYQDDRFQARVAGNFRSRRAVSENFGGINGMEVYQAPTFYVDASVSYNVMKNLQVFAQATNLTGEHERYYLVWPDQVAQTQMFDRRYMVGVRANF